MPTYLHTYIHTYIHAYIHTYLHTYMHTYTPTNQGRRKPRSPGGIQLSLIPAWIHAILITRRNTTFTYNFLSSYNFYLHAYSKAECNVRFPGPGGSLVAPAEYLPAT